jgi:hypothetical protein
MYKYSCPRVYLSSLKHQMEFSGECHVAALLTPKHEQSVRSDGLLGGPI